jgi:beta-mannosidase
MRPITPLNGTRWRLCALPAQRLALLPDDIQMPDDPDWFPAQVPGNVRTDLHRLGRIPDPHLDPSASAWVDRHPWLYETTFDLDIRPGERVYLVLEGVDYCSWTYLNGYRLSSKTGHEGMFSRQVYDITDRRGESNTLSILIQGSDHLVDGSRRSVWERLLDHIEPGLDYERADRYQTVKCQMSFGWDFSPRVRTMGVWDDVYLIHSGEVSIRDLWTRSVLDQAVSLQVTASFDAPRAGQGQLCLKLSGSNFEIPVQEHTFDITWNGGKQEISWTVPVAEPRLWWPWDHGAQPLYDLAAEVYLADGTLSDTAHERIGLRQITFEQSPGAHPSGAPWVAHVNGEPVYLRGGNWVPVDILPGAVTEGDYRTLLELARDAHMNILRVWGGGLREKRAFYDLCDEMGMLVWQEFPIACAFLTRYPRDTAYLDLFDGESRAIIRALRNHPCLALWCGGNEFNPLRHRKQIAQLRTAVQELDGTRLFRPASPYGGDIHNWDVWHGSAPVTEYKSTANNRCHIASEYGLQAPPSASQLRTFLPAEDLWPPAQAWETRKAQLSRLERYARPFLCGDHRKMVRLENLDLPTFIDASQRAQAVGLQTAIEHHRRNKYTCSGTLVWQFNEPWPSISWSLIDYLWHPKLAYQAVRRAFNPLLVSLDYPIRRYEDGDPFTPTVWVLNDRNVHYPGCCVQVLLQNDLGEVCASWLHTMAVQADSARVIGQIEWDLPEGGDWTAIARLYQGENVLSENEYTLSFYDTSKSPLHLRLRRWLSRWVLGAHNYRPDI